MNKKEVDMYYRFTSDEDPTDEQLAVIMEKVGENVRRESTEIARKLHEKIACEYKKAKEYYEQSQ
jgi:UDP-N-acetylmuramyl tripeptide synthase